MVGAAMALGWVSRVSGHSQLVMEETFHMDTTTCEGASCRREIIGANETLGVGAVIDCAPRMTYWHGTLDNGGWGMRACVCLCARVCSCVGARVGVFMVRWCSLI